MVAIKHPVLKKQFEQFSKLDSEAEKQVFWASFNKEYGAMGEAEKEKMREAWDTNVSNIDKRLKEIGSQLDKDVVAIEVFPADADERRLVEALLSRMNIRFKVA